MLLQNTKCQTESVRKAIQYGTDMDYDSALAIAEWVIKFMPYWEKPVALADMPVRIAGYRTDWIMENLVKSKVLEQVA